MQEDKLPLISGFFFWQFSCQKSRSVGQPFTLSLIQHHFCCKPNTVLQFFPPTYCTSDNCGQGCMQAWTSKISPVQIKSNTALSSAEHLGSKPYKNFSYLPDLHISLHRGQNPVCQDRKQASVSTSMYANPWHLVVWISEAKCIISRFIKR